MAFYAMLTSLEYYFNGDNNKIKIFCLFFKARDNQTCALENNSSGCVEQTVGKETADKEKNQPRAQD